jgi:phenylalanyl-tRNA synthetase beta chain
LDSVARNLRLGAETVALFEIGKVYQAPAGNSAEESVRVGFVMTGLSTPESWRGGERRTLDLFDLKGVISRLGASGDTLEFRTLTHPHLPLALEIFVGGKSIGLLGILSPGAAREIMVGGHQGQILVAEFEIASLQATASTSSLKGAELPKFPSVRRDLALLLDAATPYAAVEKAVLGAKEPLFTDILPFDVFSDPTGEKVPLGKKSLAIALTFQHADRTLKTEEVTEALGRIVTQLREKAGAEIRG